MFAALLLLSGSAATQETVGVGRATDFSITRPTGTVAGGMRIENRIDAEPDATLSKEDPHGN